MKLILAAVILVAVIVNEIASQSNLSTPDNQSTDLVTKRSRNTISTRVATRKSTTTTRRRKRPLSSPNGTFIIDQFSNRTWLGNETQEFDEDFDTD